MASSKDSNSGTPKPLRAFFIPWFATGHMIPMVDIACLFASRGVDSTLLVTPANVELIRHTVHNLSFSGLTIRTIVYPFPSVESGLPPGIENLASVPQSDIYKVDAATPHARPALESLLRLHRPDTVVADVHFSWTFSVAKDLGMAGLIFHGVGLLPVCAFRSLICHKPYDLVSDDAESFLVSGLPHPICLVRPEMPDFILRPIKELSTFGRDMAETEDTAFGAIMNSFSGIESAYADHYYKTYRVRSWFVGPVALAASNIKVDHAIRGGKDVHGGLSIKAWLDKKPSKSVVYLCFGSWCYFSTEQIAEIASGLEKSGHSFLWVVREEFELLKGFGGEKGMVVRGWAPQVEILSHSAVGGFVTHCGWNSLLEGITAGLPMVTWPLSTEQFINEKLLVDVMRIGVKNWNGFRTTVAEKVVVVNGDDFGAAVRKIMDSDEEAEGMRQRAREYGDMAREAVREGGSSYDGLNTLIDEIRAYSLGRQD